MGAELGFEHVASCDSTQALAADRVSALPPKRVHAVLADSQLQGRGRAGRRWEDPPGAALLLSIASRGPWARRVLDDLPRRLAFIVTTALTDQYELPAGHIGWKSPNDIVATSATAYPGAKVGGILIDARSTSSSVTHLVVGIGANLAGGAFRTSDGRAAVAIDALQGGVAGVDRETRRLAHTIVLGLQRLLLAGS